MSQDDWLMGSVATQDTYNPDEGAFQAGIRATPWHSEFTAKYGEPNLNDPNYDYRAAWAAGARPTVRDPSDQMLHWPSIYKGENHPNRYVGGVDTRAPGVLAATDVYNAFDVPLEQSTNVPGALLNAGNWFLQQAAKPEAEAQADVRNVMGALAAPVMVPGQMMKPNPYPSGSEEAAFYDASKLQTATQWGPEMALNMVGSGAPFAEAGALGTSGGKGIRAYHSSPHDFDKFDLAKIGTGEGAQVYGHGLYFAESPAVSGQGGQYWQQFKNRFKGDEAQAMEMLQSSKFDRGQAVEAAQRQIDELQRRINPGGIFDKPHMADAWRRAQEQIAELSAHRDLLASGQPVGPRTYEVNINADPAHMLDWDKALSAHPEAVRDVLARTAWKKEGATAADLAELGVTGEHAYKRLITGEGGTALPGRSRQPQAIAATEALREAGIPGIKYLDEGSRISTPTQIDLIRQNIAHREALLAERPGDPTNTKWLAEYQDMLRRAENPTSNYVVFDPGIIDIMKKYGIAGAAPVGMGALAAQDTYRE